MSIKILLRWKKHTQRSLSNTKPVNWGNLGAKALLHFQRSSLLQHKIGNADHFVNQTGKNTDQRGKYKSYCPVQHPLHPVQNFAIHLSKSLIAFKNLSPLWSRWQFSRFIVLCDNKIWQEIEGNVLKGTKKWNILWRFTTHAIVRKNVYEAVINTLFIKGHNHRTFYWGSQSWQDSTIRNTLMFCVTIYICFRNAVQQTLKQKQKNLLGICEGWNFKADWGVQSFH